MTSSTIPREVLWSGGDDLPLSVDLDLRTTPDGTDTADRHRSFDDVLDDVRGAAMPYIERLPGKAVRLARTEPHPPRLAAAVAAAGPRSSLEAGIAELVHTSGAANLIATLRHRAGRGFRLPDEVGPGPEPALLVGLHIGPPAATGFHLAAAGASVAHPVYRYARPSPFLGLCRVAETARFPDTASLRVVPVPHPMGAHALNSAARAGRTVVWQPDAIVGGAGARSSVPMELFGVERDVSPLPYLLLERHELPCWLGFSRVAPDGEVDFHYRRLSPPRGEIDRFFRYLTDVTEEAICANVDQWTQWVHYPHV